MNNALDTIRLGTDLDFPVDAAGVVRVTIAGDLPTVSGRANLVNALSRRLATEPGALVYRPTYGCGVLSYLGAPNSPGSRADLATKVRANLLRDTRLKDVVATVEQGTPSDAAMLIAITVSLSLTLRDDSQSSLTLTFERS